ncbi:MAG: ammonium transporter [Planctomycetota bacterium]|nr:MAG: ammonium transporter [Planctomycetota bacterium]
MFTVNTLWILIAACLVFIMHLGFSTLEVGLTRAKNTSNILFKNVAILGIGLLTYALIGFNLMYGASGGWIGTIELGLNPGAGAQSMANANGHYPFWADFIFQGMFAATCATIVSGAVAERVKLAPFLIFSTIFVGICYPIMGNWKWGGGFLDGMGFYDFAGSTLVHSVGGWAALAAIIVLGPRIAKYGPDGKTKAIPGHSMPLATIGVFLLFFGWFGFNGGSVLSADPESVARVITMTALAGAAGIIGSMIAAWIILKKPDLSMVLNGALAGLVGITAGADQMGVIDTCVIGTIAGVLVVVAVLVFDKLKLDDPVGATSVHLVCGIWGTLAVGIFGNMKGMTQFVTQLKGVAIYGIATLISAFAILFIIKMAMGFRVTKEEEIIGLDIEEHGMEAYAGFQIFNNQ